MPLIQDFSISVKDYQNSSFQLSKCSDFLKSQSKNYSKQVDFFSFCSFNCGEDIVQELDELVEKSKTKPWKTPISSFEIDKNVIGLKLLRKAVYEAIFNEVSESTTGYGFTDLFKQKCVNVQSAECKDGLTRLRLRTAADVVRAVTSGGGSVTTSASTETQTVVLSHTGQPGTVLVSPVRLGAQEVSEEQFVRLRTKEILEISDHKEVDEQFICHLVNASIVFDMLSIRLEKPLHLQPEKSLDKAARKSNSKGASFVLYNYARLCGILERYDHFVSTGVYRPLPSLQDVNYSLLTLKEEWSLVFHHMAEWPTVLAECSCLSQPKLHRIPTFLSSLASTFSIYYRHSRVLNEGLAHLQPLMEARIHLLLALKQVFENSFSLLGITAPTSM